MGSAKVDKAAGKAKEVLGKATGNRKLENEGKLDQAGASIREVADEVAEGVAGTVGKTIDSVGNAAGRLQGKLAGQA